MRTVQSIAFLFYLLGCLTQATSSTHRSLSAASKVAIDDVEDMHTNASDAGSTSKAGETAATDSSDDDLLSDDNIAETPDSSDARPKHSKRVKKTNHTDIVSGQQETNYVSTSLSQWDITNKTMLSTKPSTSKSTFPKERPQSTGWVKLCLVFFLGIALLLFGLTVFQRYQKRRQYHDASEIQSLVV